MNSNGIRGQEGLYDLNYSLKHANEFGAVSSKERTKVNSNIIDSKSLSTQLFSKSPVLNKEFSISEEWLDREIDRLEQFGENIEKFERQASRIKNMSGSNRIRAQLLESTK